MPVLRAEPTTQDRAYAGTRTMSLVPVSMSMLG